MKLFLLLAMSIVTLNAVSAQNSWKVVLNNKNILSSATESEEINKVTIKAADLKKKKEFSINYAEKPKIEDWVRSILVVGDNDVELLNQETSQLKIKNYTLNSFFKKSKTLKIYTISLPRDPAKRAAVRVRRVHLCTLILRT